MGKVICAAAVLAAMLPLQTGAVIAEEPNLQPGKQVIAKAAAPEKSDADERYGPRSRVRLQGEEFGFTTFTEMEERMDELLADGWDIVTLTPHARPHEHHFITTLQKDREFVLCRLLLADAAYMRSQFAKDSRVTGAFATCFKLTK